MYSVGYKLWLFKTAFLVEAQVLNETYWFDSEDNKTICLHILVLSDVAFLSIALWLCVSCKT